VILPGTVTSIIKSGKPFPNLVGKTVTEKQLASGAVKTAYDVLKDPKFSSDWDKLMKTALQAGTPTDKIVAAVSKSASAAEKKKTSSVSKPSAVAAAAIPTKAAAAAAKVPAASTTSSTISPSMLGAEVAATGLLGGITGAASNLFAGTETQAGDAKMSIYTRIDDALAGMMPGGVKLQWGEAALKGLAAYGGYRLGSAAAGMSVGSALSSMFGGKSARKVKRGRIGVRRSDYKRIKRALRDLHTLDKFVNRAGLADIKFRHAGPASPTRVRIARDSIISAGSVYGNVFVDTAYSAADINISGTVDGSGLFRCEGTISNGANVGDFQLLWAQRSSDANNTTVLAGSYLEWRQV